MTIGKPPKVLVDREEEISKLVSSMLDARKNVNYALIGHRRIGKTTILREVEKRLDDKVLTIYVDFSEWRLSPLEFAETIVEKTTRAYAKTLSPSSRLLVSVKAALTEITKIKRLRAEFQVSLDETGRPTISINPYVKPEDVKYTEMLEKAFDFVNQVSERSGKRIVVIIDEFQHLVSYKAFKGLETIIEKFRAILERRENVSFIISGSRVHFLRDLLGLGGSPIFGHFVIMEIGELSKEFAMELYSRTVEPQFEDEAQDAYNLAGGHPYYLVMLAEARRKDEITKQTYERLLTTPTGALYLYVNYILTEDLGAKFRESYYIRIMKTLAGHEKTVSQIAKTSNVPLSTLPKYLGKLVEYDLVEKTKGKYRIQDKIINDYFRLITA